jgi:hypothetical protein
LFPVSTSKRVINSKSKWEYSFMFREISPSSTLNTNSLFRSRAWPCFLHASCLVSSSALKMEAQHVLETPVDLERTTRHCIPNGRTGHNKRCENLNSYLNENSYK